MGIGELGVCFLLALPLAGLELQLEPESVTVQPWPLEEHNAPQILMTLQILKLAMSRPVQVSIMKYSGRRLILSLWDGGKENTLSGCHCSSKLNEIQWQPLNVIPLGRRKGDHIIQMITMSLTTLYLFSFQKCRLANYHLLQYKWSHLAASTVSLTKTRCLFPFPLNEASFRKLMILTLYLTINSEQFLFHFLTQNLTLTFNEDFIFDPICKP